MQINVFENEELAQLTKNGGKYEEVIPVVKEDETIISPQQNGILNIVFGQGKIFKRFKNLERFVEMAKELGVSRPTVSFKLNLLKILKKYRYLKKTSLSLKFLQKLLENN